MSTIYEQYIKQVPLLDAGGVTPGSAKPGLSAAASIARFFPNFAYSHDSSQTDSFSLSKVSLSCPKNCLVSLKRLS